MLRKAIPSAVVSDNIIKTLPELVGAVIAGRLVINRRMVNGYLSSSWNKVRAVFGPEFACSCVNHNVDIVTSGILVTAILRAFKKRGGDREKTN